jgi:hypothetical protein
VALLERESIRVSEPRLTVLSTSLMSSRASPSAGASSFSTASWAVATAGTIGAQRASISSWLR